MYIVSKKWIGENFKKPNQILSNHRHGEAFEAVSSAASSNMSSKFFEYKSNEVRVKKFRVPWTDFWVIFWLLILDKSSLPKLFLKFEWNFCS